VESRVRLEAASFSPRGFESFVFEDASRTFAAQDVFESKGDTLDARGRHAYAVTLPEGLRPPASLQAVVTARVSESGGRGVAAQRRLAVHPYPYYLGLRRKGDGAPAPHEKVTFEYVAVAPPEEAAAGAPGEGSADDTRAQGETGDSGATAARGAQGGPAATGAKGAKGAKGAAGAKGAKGATGSTGAPRTPASAPLVKARALRAELYEDRWNTVLRVTPSGSYRYECERVARLIDTRAIPAGSSRGEFTFVPATGGEYRAAISDPETGASSQIEFYASEWGYAAWRSRIQPHRDRCRQDRIPRGEAATLLVRDAVPGRLLVVVGRDGVEETQIHDLAGNSARLTIPIRGSYRPNVYVSAILVRAAGSIEVGRPGRAFGALSLDVERASGRAAHHDRRAAGDPAAHELTVSVRSERGAAITIAAVDEGILQLVGQKTPIPMRTSTASSRWRCARSTSTRCCSRR
jgi:uncharacterized protein YfaS (alpha-2-macroglobulin family)